MSKREKEIHAGSGNVFSDIGALHPERVLARAQIMSQIAKILEDRNLTQREAGKILDLPQSKVSCLMNGKLSIFSLEHLLSLLNALDRDVEIIIKPKVGQEAAGITQVLMATVS